MDPGDIFQTVVIVFLLAVNIFLHVQCRRLTKEKDTAMVHSRRLTHALRRAETAEEQAQLLQEELDALNAMTWENTP